MNAETSPESDSPANHPLTPEKHPEPVDDHSGSNTGHPDWIAELVDWQIEQGGAKGLQR